MSGGLCQNRRVVLSNSDPVKEPGAAAHLWLHSRLFRRFRPGLGLLCRYIFGKFFRFHNAVILRCGRIFLKLAAILLAAHAPNPARSSGVG